MFLGRAAVLCCKRMGQAQGCDPIGVVEGPCRYPEG